MKQREIHMNPLHTFTGSQSRCRGTCGVPPHGTCWQQDPSSGDEVYGWSFPTCQRSRRRHPKLSVWVHSTLSIPSIYLTEYAAETLSTHVIRRDVPTRGHLATVEDTVGDFPNVTLSAVLFDIPTRESRAFVIL